MKLQLKVAPLTYTM